MTSRQVPTNRLRRVSLLRRWLMLGYCRLFNRDQAYYWTKEWQEGERASEADYAAGRYRSFDSANDLIKDLTEGYQERAAEDLAIAEGNYGGQCAGALTFDQGPSIQCERFAGHKGPHSGGSSTWTKL